MQLNKIANKFLQCTTNKALLFLETIWLFVIATNQLCYSACVENKQ